MILTFLTDLRKCSELEPYTLMAEEEEENFPENINLTRHFSKHRFVFRVYKKFT